MKDACEPAFDAAVASVAVILAGGIGTRLWPLSDSAEPKQLARALASPSLLQRTVARLQRCLDEMACRALPAAGRAAAGSVPVDARVDAPVHAPARRTGPISAADAPMVVVCGAAHAGAAMAQLEEAACPVALLLEPVRRNTAPALTAAALWACRHHGDPVMVVAPADHDIEDEEAFRESVAHACRLAAQGRVVSLGVEATHAESGYGYIELGETVDDLGACAMRAFREKPDQATAARYAADGRHLWNTGICVMRASVWLSLIRRYEPQMLAACKAALPSAPADAGRHALEPGAFRASPARSIDHAVMERLPGDLPHLAVTVRLRSPWSDLGSWDALWRIAERDTHGNARRGAVTLRDVAGSLVYAHGRQVACLGLKDVVVVETDRAVLVADRGRAQELGLFAAECPADTGQEDRGIHAVRPWGRYEVLSERAGYRVKRLLVDPGQSLSLQRHRHRGEHWMVLRGQARVTLEGRCFMLHPGGTVSIPVGALHRLANVGAVCLEVLETQLGDDCDEGDIERVADMYGRA